MEITENERLNERATIKEVKHLGIVPCLCLSLSEIEVPEIRTELCRDMYTDMLVVIYIDMSEVWTELCIYMCIDMSTEMCVDMCIDKHVCRHVYKYACTPCA